MEGMEDSVGVQSVNMPQADGDLRPRRKGLQVLWAPLTGHDRTALAYGQQCKLDRYNSAVTPWLHASERKPNPATEQSQHRNTSPQSSVGSTVMLDADDKKLNTSRWQQPRREDDEWLPEKRPAWKGRNAIVPVHELNWQINSQKAVEP